MNEKTLTQQGTSDNDFLVGDTIVLKDGKTILTVEHVWSDGDIWCSNGGIYPSRKVRHATAEEIAAGKRLNSTNRMESLYIDKKKQCELLQTEVARLNATIERQAAEIVAMQARIDELTAENAGLHQAATTHFRNQNHYMDLYHKLVCELYPYAIDLQEPLQYEESSGRSKDYVDAYNRAYQAMSATLLEMMQGDEKYIRMQCDMLGDEA